MNSDGQSQLLNGNLLTGPDFMSVMSCFRKGKFAVEGDLDQDLDRCFTKCLFTDKIQSYVFGVMTQVSH